MTPEGNKMSKTDLIPFCSPDHLSTDQKLALAELDSQTREYIRNALSSSTHRLYKSDFRQFAGWCASHGLAPLPALPETVARFLSFEAGRGIKPSTLIRRVAAIRMFHEASGNPSPTQHRGVKAAMKGIRREKGSAQRKKAPATAGRVAAMVAHCDLDTLTGLRDRALLLLGFAGAFRRSELVALRVDDIERTPEGIKVSIRRSKTDQEGMGQVVAILNGAHLWAVDALMAWLSAAGITGGHIFRPINKWNQVRPAGLTGESVALTVKKYASKAGLTVKDFSGHSLRAGFITSGAAAGADLFKLMEVSRHRKPETVMGYVRESRLFENHAGEKFL
jgi:site-specific recombinase XerD